MQRTQRPIARPPLATLAAPIGACLALAGCMATAPTNTPASSGAAGGSTAVGADSRLQTCTETVGTVRLQDGTTEAAAPQGRPGGGENPGLLAMLNPYALLAGASAGGGRAPSGGGGNASLDSMRLLIQQSNCFGIVDRGLVAEAAADDEKRRTRDGRNEVRDDANMGPGQEIAADFVLRASIVSMGTTQSRGINLGVLTKFLGNASAGQSVTEAKVQLVLSDVRSKLQVAVAQGSSSASNTGLAMNVLGRAGAGLGGIGLKQESTTSGATILLQAYADAYNQMVPAVQNYKAQQVRNGMGTGGMLKVQGSRTDASGGPK